MYSTELTSMIIDMNDDILDLEDIAYVLAISEVKAKEMYHKYGKDIISELFQELYNRSNLRPDIILNLHSWVLKNVDLGENPKVFINKNGEYFTKKH